MAEKSKVIIVPCDSYEKEQVYRSVKAGIKALGGMEAFLNKSEKILVKPNFLSAAQPEKAVTTHPAVIEAVFRILHEEELLAMLEMQEEILQFTHFTNEDAWELGKLIVSEIQRQKLPVAVTIRLNNGYTVFRYAANGTNIQNENWMQRKFNTVRTLETSTLHAAMLLKKSEQTLADWFLDEKEYAAAGGGFPIRIEEVGVIGAVIVSGLPHFADHDLIVKCISRYLHVDEVPRIRGSVNI